MPGSEISIPVYRDLMGANDEWAGRNRVLLASAGVTMINIIGSPGAGKTALLERAAAALGMRFGFAVLEGDVETTRDAQRLGKLGVTVSQLITGGGCHLEARMIHAALNDLPLEELDLVVVENVGNLVCPAEFDIGERAKVAVLSVTEGEDKPEKYPLLFREAQAVVLSKVDLLPYVSFDVDACLADLSALNGAIPVFRTSATTGEGIEGWLAWLAGFVAATPQA
jgi:hydrogenase nickel incorporation protein HypB